MAMKMLRPTEFMNQTVDDGMRPNVGRTERNHPATIPAMSAPPAVDSVSGTPPIFNTSEPISAPTTMAGADERDVGNIGWPIRNTQALVMAMFLCAADDVENVTAIDLRVGQNRNRGCNRAPRDLPQDLAGCGAIGATSLTPRHDRSSASRTGRR